MVYKISDQKLQTYWQQSFCELFEISWWLFYRYAFRAFDAIKYVYSTDDATDSSWEYTEHPKRHTQTYTNTVTHTQYIYIYIYIYITSYTYYLKLTNVHTHTYTHTHETTSVAVSRSAQSRGYLSEVIRVNIYSQKKQIHIR